MGCTLLWCSRTDQLIWATVNPRLYPRGWAWIQINGWLFTFMNQLVLDFLQCCLITVFSTIILHSLSGKEVYTDSIFNHSYTTFPALKEMEFAVAWKDISKETGLTMTVTIKTAFPWRTLFKALFLRWHKVRATSSLYISEDWKAACPHSNSLLGALPSTRCSMIKVLSVHSILSPTCVSWPFSGSLDLDG